MGMSAFSIFDRDGSGSLDTHELVAVNGYLYYSLSPKDVSRIVKEVDVDGSGTVSRSEFLVYMRMVRDLELQRIQRAISFSQSCSLKRASTAESSQDCGADAETAAINLRGPLLELFFRHLGYAPCAQVIREVAEDVGLQSPVR